VFARKLRIEIEENGVCRPCPLDWLDHFFMRDFTGASAFDETLPAGDGLLEAGLRVDPAAVAAQFEQWLRGRRMIPVDAALHVS
jgi:hypothetical protein